MADHKGDKIKQPDFCNDGYMITDQFRKCSNLKNTYEGYDGERYRCDVCGMSYFLDYDDMQ